MSLTRGVLGSPRHSPHLWFIPSAHLDFFAIFVIPSPHLDNHTFTSPRVQIMPSPHLELHTLNSPRGQIISYLLQLKSNSIVDVPLIFQTTIPNFRGAIITNTTIANTSIFYHKEHNIFWICHNEHKISIANTEICHKEHRMIELRFWGCEVVRPPMLYEAESQWVQTMSDT